MFDIVDSILVLFLFLYMSLLSVEA